MKRLLFNSAGFFIFFPLVAGIYYLLPHRYRWVWLLAASYYFFMSWNPQYIVLIAASTAVSYGAALAMDRAEGARRRHYLLASLAVNLGILFVFKYFNFFNDSLRMAFAHFNAAYGIPSFRLLLPVGISFYTFQILSYNIDVYRGKRAPERHFGRFALYVSFFPLLVAGPIERPDKLLPQLEKEQRFDYDRAVDGLKLMAWGYFQKVAVADRLAIVVNTVYDKPGAFGGPDLALATVCFAFQLYYDFAGYSDIARGAARVLGIELTENFRRPYLARSVAEFWRRWHISLSTWFRDYVYIPLGGNRVKRERYYANLFATFLMSGLWHGASWTFVIWGAMHGLLQILEKVSEPARLRAARAIRLERVPALGAALATTGTFAFVCFVWIFFRANTVSDAWLVVRGLPAGWGTAPTVDRFQWQLSLLLIAGLQLVHWREEKAGSWGEMLARAPWPLRWSFYYLMLFAIIILGVYGHAANSQFIYAQF